MQGTENIKGDLEVWNGIGMFEASNIRNMRIKDIQGIGVGATSNSFHKSILLISLISIGTQPLI